MYRKLLTHFLLFCTAALLSGCGIFGLNPFEAAGVIAKNKTDSRMAYDNYVFQSRKDNSDRESKKLAPIPIESYKDWMKARSL
jgi:hypothetical protein